MASTPLRQRSDLLLIDAPRSRTLGLAVAAGAVLATTALIYLLRPVTPAVSTGASTCWPSCSCPRTGGCGWGC